ncbi:MAG TPA: DUF515 domain-containing protein [Methanothermococcus okinawensis]|uniref:DUF515 domain-containing protein n=1 Tax=Methanothermococcus okinawensis TaxID=155863 RepID=A0A832ZR20_9EURY|nr:DUF515 domain-containing protein [Methanothermococcus okinawensis]
MVNDDFNRKLKRVKSKSKTIRSDRTKFIIILVVVVLTIIVSFVAYTVHKIEMEKLEEAKTRAIENIKQIFSSYPEDPYLHIYITKIENSNSIEEINKILSDAKRYVELKKSKENAIKEVRKIFEKYNYTDDPYFHLYITKIKNSKSIEEINRLIQDATKYVELRKYKEEVISYIKDLYGKYYHESVYAQSIVSKIQEAKSREEIDNILKTSNIEENAKMYYLIDIGNKIDPNKYYIVYLFEESEIWEGSKIIDYIKKLSLTNLKDLSKDFSKKIVPATFSKVAIEVPATQCGKMPLKGSKIRIYDKSNNSITPIKGVVQSSYLLIDEISYTEFTNVTNIHTDDWEVSILQSISNTTYSLQNVPGIIYATAANKLDYHKVIKKFGRYGERLNKITSDTQIFDENAKYLLIVSVPSVEVPKLKAIEIENIYIAVME